MTRPRQHWRRVKTKQGIVPRIINRGRMWIKQHFSHPQTGDLTPEETQYLLFKAAQRKRREQAYDIVSGKGIRSEPEPEDIQRLRQKLRLRYPEPPREGV